MTPPILPFPLLVRARRIRDGSASAGSLQWDDLTGFDSFVREATAFEEQVGALPPDMAEQVDLAAGAMRAAGDFIAASRSGA